MVAKISKRIIIFLIGLILLSGCEKEITPSNFNITIELEYYEKTGEYCNFDGLPEIRGEWYDCIPPSITIKNGFDWCGWSWVFYRYGIVCIDKLPKEDFTFRFKDEKDRIIGAVTIKGDTQLIKNYSVECEGEQDGNYLCRGLIND